MVSSNLSWSPQVANMVAKGRGAMAWVLSVFRSRDREPMLTLYKSLIRSHLEYCCPLWHPSKLADIELLEGVQREFTSKINSQGNLSYWERLQDLGLLSLQRRRERYIILIMWKILNNKIPNINVHFRPESRLGIQAIVPSLQPGSRALMQSLYDDSFSVVGPMLWNTLPNKLTIIKSENTFKSKLTKLLRMLSDEPPVSGYARSNNNSPELWLP